MKVKLKKKGPKKRSQIGDKDYARSAVQNAIKRGDLVRKPCEVCGEKAEAHHDDYSKPLKVRWLCPKHHRQVHISTQKPRL